MDTGTTPPTGIEDLANRLPPDGALGESAKKIPVIEMFGPVLEGEGKLAGTQTMFIRFGLCDYKCLKCDSMHAVNPMLVKKGATYLTQLEIAHNLLTGMEKKGVNHIQNVTFSGGNPAIHELGQLVKEIQSMGKKVFIETQGTKCPDWLFTVDHIVVSPKSPGMGEKFEPEVFRTFLRKWSTASKLVDLSVKVVIFSPLDIEFAVGVAQICAEFDRYGDLDYQNNFYLSLGNDAPPVFGMGPDGNVGQENFDKNALVGNLLMRYNILSEDVLKDHRLAFAKFLPQLHVLQYGNESGR